MIGNIFHAVLFLPLYNALIWLSAILPGADLGLAIIILTLIVRLALFPLQHQMTKTQKALKKIEPELAELKTKYADNKNEQAKQMMTLYQKHGINPFSGFILLLIQIPILLALFWVFRGSFTINHEWIYSFVTPPTALNTKLFGLLDITSRNYYLAFLVGLSQFIQMRLALPPAPVTPTSVGPSLKADFGRSLNWQMRYFMPGMVIVIAVGLPAAIPLYWLTSNLFAIGHELLVRRKAEQVLGK